MGAIFYGLSALSGFAEWMVHPIIKMTQSFIGRSALNVGRWTLGVGRWALDVQNSPIGENPQNHFHRWPCNPLKNG